MSDLQFNKYVREPFVVEAIEITEDNIDELAARIGVIKVKDGERYISVDRRVVPNISRVFVGWWVTEFMDNLRCYSPLVFEEQFMAVPDHGVVAFNFSDADNVVVLGGDPVFELNDPPAIIEDDGSFVAPETKNVFDAVPEGWPVEG